MKDSTIRIISICGLIVLGLGLITSGVVAVINHQVDAQINQQTEVQKTQIIEANKTERAEKHLQWLPWN